MSPNNRTFFPDDIDRINSKYFEALRNRGDIIADPSFWYKNESGAAKHFGYQEFGPYRSDYHQGLKNEKIHFLNALSKWDNCTYSFNDITICSTATSASFIVLSYIRHVLKIDSIIFETPCYFASVKQANYLGFDCAKVPTYFSSNFYPPIDSYQTDKPKAIWLTQPRFGLGDNYSIETLEGIIDSMNHGDILVIDEAAENSFPAPLGKYNFQNDSRIIKIRSPFKGIGINGPRISQIIHGPNRRAQIQIGLEIVQGAIDAFSLKFSVEVLSSVDRYLSMLSFANIEVAERNKKLTTRTIGSTLRLTHVDGGYIGSALVEYQSNDLPHFKKREQLLAFCAEHRMPVLLGANMNFAIDPRFEQVRISYFNPESDLVQAIDVLAKFSR